MFFPSPSVALSALVRQSGAPTLTELINVTNFYIFNMREKIEFAPKKKPIIDGNGVLLSEPLVMKRLNEFRRKIKGKNTYTYILTLKKGFD